MNTLQALLNAATLGRPIAKNKAIGFVLGLTNDDTSPLLARFRYYSLRSEYRKAIKTGNPAFFEDLLKAVNIQIESGDVSKREPKSAPIVRWLAYDFIGVLTDELGEAIHFKSDHTFKEIKAAYIAHFKIESFTKSEDKKLRKAIDEIGYKFKKPGDA